MLQPQHYTHTHTHTFLISLATKIFYFVIYLFYDPFLFVLVFIVIYDNDRFFLCRWCVFGLFITFFYFTGSFSMCLCVLFAQNCLHDDDAAAVTVVCLAVWLNLSSSDKPKKNLTKRQWRFYCGCHWDCCGSTQPLLLVERHIAPESRQRTKSNAANDL